MLRPAFRMAAATSALALAFAAGSASLASAVPLENGDFQVGLHNDAAGVGECPGGIPDGTYWHFVAPPKSKTDFQSITLVIDGVPTVIDTWYERPPAGDAYVMVPSGATIDSLTKEGSVFVYSGGTDEDVRLSHTCTVGGGVERLQVTKTAATSYTRSHAWDVDKDDVKLYTDGSGDTTLQYRVDVTHTGSQDSGHAVAGTVTIVNTGDFDANITAITDTMTLGTAIYTPDLACDGEGVLAKGATRTCAYAQAVSGAVDGTNEVVVTTDVRDYGDDAAVTWGAPTTEVDKQVTVTDVGDLSGTRGQTFTAPTGGSLSYSVPLAYADFGQARCGNHTFGNVATLTGDGDAVLDTADASVSVKVQCLVFAGETAWTNGTIYPKQNSWAMFTEYAPDLTVDLMAGQHHDAGDVTFSAVSDGKVTISISLADGWTFKAAKENLKVQGYAKSPSGKVSPGQFADKMNCPADSSTCEITVSAATFYGVHVEVGRWIPDPSF